MAGEDIKKRVGDAVLRFARLPLKAMPLWMEAIGFGVFLSDVVDKNPSLKAKLGELDKKTFLFEARDIKKSFYLTIEGGDIKVSPHSAKKPDVTMRGEVRTLTEVLLGRTDPDTVFFSRRLEITGDTAAAIHFKNILASIG